ncbi:hypothetical protein E2C01_044804 [Portunus trituberculatus]|uniref:Uncharacterized protein n=1 Tax=Portunus trituberculatus TaxID=210409 RepID=A0A5B7G0G9_PORTR|nr:hypothetical protein [Portunus trituberculatus]
MKRHSFPDSPNTGLTEYPDKTNLLQRNLKKTSRYTCTQVNIPQLHNWTSIITSALFPPGHFISLGK